MKICIHGGQNQIGGSLIEVISDKTRLFFDLGLEISETNLTATPKIEGLFQGIENCDGIFISHYHMDHIGLTDRILDNIQVYMGERSFSIYKTARTYVNKSLKFIPNFIYDGEIITVGDFEITPILCDHSSFDSYMFLIKHNDITVLYTGDFRNNGRLNFDALLQRLPKVNALIIEGTLLSRDSNISNIKECELENIGKIKLEEHSGPAFILCSAMNIDRVLTAHNIAKKSKRLFLEDTYTAVVSVSSGVREIEPNIKNGIRVFTTGGDKEYEILKNFRTEKIGMDGISKTKFLMCIRQSMEKYLCKLNNKISFEDGVLFYSIWSGYKEKPEMKSFLECMKGKGVKIQALHTSGHADIKSIDKIIKRVDPKFIIPVHTENPYWFEKYSNDHQIIYQKDLELN